MVAFDIEWMAEQEDVLNLPTEVELPEGLGWQNEDAVSDWLTATYGFGTYWFFIKE